MIVKMMFVSYFLIISTPGKLESNIEIEIGRCGIGALKLLLQEIAREHLLFRMKF